MTSEKRLFLTYGKRWNIIVKHKIVIAHHDSVNVIRCNEYMMNHNCIVIKRITRRFRIFGTFIYLNTLYGGLEKEGVYERQNN